MTIITDERCTAYHSPGHPERPFRVSGPVKKLKAQTDLKLQWLKPEPAPKAKVLRAHTTNHFQRLAESHDFDGDTAYHEGIRDHALRSVGGALKALDLAKAGKPNLSLLRPPGHHATKERAMGFCYLGSVAIAALEAKATGSKKVAVFDFDVHHGNGTEDILAKRDGVAFFSIHQHPAYPGTGTESFDNCRNYTARPNLPREDYRKIAERAVADLKAYDPDLVIVSAGFDAYAGDPLCNQKLSVEDFRWFGKTLANASACQWPARWRAATATTCPTSCSPICGASSASKNLSSSAPSRSTFRPWHTSSNSSAPSSFPRQTWPASCISPTTANIWRRPSTGLSDRSATRSSPTKPTRGSAGRASTLSSTTKSRCASRMKSRFICSSRGCDPSRSPTNSGSTKSAATNANSPPPAR